MTSVSVVDWNRLPRLTSSRRERHGVGQVAVVAEGEAAELEVGEQRLDVALDRIAGRGVAVVADRRCARAGARCAALEVKLSADEAEAARGVEMRAVVGDDAGRFLAAVLQRVQAERRQRRPRRYARKRRRRRIPRADGRRQNGSVVGNVDRPRSLRFGGLLIMDHWVPVVSSAACRVARRAAVSLAVAGRLGGRLSRCSAIVAWSTCCGDPCRACCSGHDGEQAASAPFDQDGRGAGLAEPAGLVARADRPAAGP